MIRFIALFLVASLFLGIVAPPPAAQARTCGTVVAVDHCKAPLRDAGSQAPEGKSCSKYLMLDPAAAAEAGSAMSTLHWDTSRPSHAGISPDPLRRPPRG